MAANNEPAPGEDLLDAQLRALISPFVQTLTPHQQERYFHISDLLAKQDRIESDKATDRRGDILERAIEGLIAHLTDPARLFRLLWRHCNAGPVDELDDCCRSWVEP